MIALKLHYTQSEKVNKISFEKEICHFHEYICEPEIFSKYALKICWRWYSGILGYILIKCLVGENQNNCLSLKKKNTRFARRNQNPYGAHQLTKWPLKCCSATTKKSVTESVIYISITNSALKKQSISDLWPDLKNIG